MSIGFKNSTLDKFFTEVLKQKLLIPMWPDENGVVYYDQTLLPFELKKYIAHSPDDLANAIRSMQIRGSGAIGCAGAFGAALAVFSAPDDPQRWSILTNSLRTARPTAVILEKAIAEVINEASKHPKESVEIAADTAVNFFLRQLKMEHAIGEYGQELIPDGSTVLTHCNSGALAGAGYGGRALSVIRAAMEAGKKIQVIAQETRPYLQGARITAWELDQLQIPVKLATDGMSAALMQKNLIDVCIVGSDRIAANGDLINKVGTCLIALAAREYRVPFYTVTTFYNVDLLCPDGISVPIEMRSGKELVSINGHPITLPTIDGIYPSFDITHASLLSGIITESGVLYPPYHSKLVKLVNGESIF